jgi:hypothetical protein
LKKPTPQSEPLSIPPTSLVLDEIFREGDRRLFHAVLGAEIQKYLDRQQQVLDAHGHHPGYPGRSRPHPHQAILEMLIKLCHQVQKSWRKLDGSQFPHRVIANIKFLDGELAGLDRKSHSIFIPQQSTIAHGSLDRGQDH